MKSLSVPWSIVPTLGWVGFFPPLKNEAQPRDGDFLGLVTLRLSSAGSRTLTGMSERS